MVAPFGRLINILCSAKRASEHVDLMFDFDFFADMFSCPSAKRRVLHNRGCCGLVVFAVSGSPPHRTLVALPSGCSRTAANSTMRSLAALRPVVSRSKATSGRVSCSRPAGQGCFTDEQQSHGWRGAETGRMSMGHEAQRKTQFAPGQGVMAIQEMLSTVGNYAIWDAWREGCTAGRTSGAVFWNCKPMSKWAQPAASSPRVLPWLLACAGQLLTSSSVAAPATLPRPSRPSAQWSEAPLPSLPPAIGLAQSTGTAAGSLKS